jgi:hypothetical protein
MKDSAFVKELGFILIAKLLLIGIIWFVFFKPIKPSHEQEERTVVFDKEFIRDR